MDIRLAHLSTHILKDQAGGSDIWNQALAWSSPDIWEVIAPSGTGKSTFVRVLFGLSQDYQGEYFLDGQEARALRASQWQQVRREQISCVFQGLSLFPQLTVWENLAIKRKLAPNAVSDAEVITWLERLDILRLKDKRVDTISFGQAQRLAIVRALCQPFSLLLLDEPFSHLDEGNARLAWDLMAEVASSKQAGIIITGLSSHPYITPTHAFAL